MRIDLVTDTFPPDVNGVAMTLGRLSQGLRARGHLVHVIRTGGAVTGPGETCAASIAMPGYREVRVGLPGPVKLRARWQRKRPDAVYVATESLLGNSAIKAAVGMGIPVATGFHTNFHDYAGQYRMRGLQPAAMAYLRRVHNRSDLTLAPSMEVVEMLRREGFENVGLLGRGVDTGLFHPARRDEALRAEWGVRSAVPVALVVGRVAAEKNLDLAMAAYRRMRTALPDARCVVVGDGPLRERLEGRYPEVIFAGTRHGEDLARHYASADLLLFPSETETFGNVLLEGMASGLVTLSYDYAAAAQHVVHESNGLKVVKGDANAYLDAAAGAMGPARGSLRARARETAESLSWAEVVETFENHLSGMVRHRVNASVTRKKKDRKVAFRTIFLSDIHLGTPNSKVHEVVDFLKHTTCAKLVLNGDIIDGWALRRGGEWRKRHTRFIRTVLKKMEKESTRVVYLRGNHDDILERFLPLQFGGLEFVKEHIHTGTDGRRFLVVHGDGFDRVSTDYRWVAMLGAAGYDLMLKINRLYNHYRAWRGREYFSISKAIKARVKSAVSFVDRYEHQLQELARLKHCDGIICGHIHTPEDKMINGIRYLNSGDWVESLSAVVEHLDGRFELIRYAEFVDRLGDPEPAPVVQAVSRV